MSLLGTITLLSSLWVWGSPPEPALTARSSSGSKFTPIVECSPFKRLLYWVGLSIVTLCSREANFKEIFSIFYFLGLFLFSLGMSPVWCFRSDWPIFLFRMLGVGWLTLF